MMIKRFFIKLKISYDIAMIANFAINHSYYPDFVIYGEADRIKEKWAKKVEEGKVPFELFDKSFNIENVDHYLTFYIEWLKAKRGM